MFPRTLFVSALALLPTQGLAEPKKQETATSTTVINASGCRSLCDAIKNAGWKTFTPEQKKAADACAAANFCVASPKFDGPDIPQMAVKRPEESLPPYVRDMVNG